MRQKLEGLLLGFLQEKRRKNPSGHHTPKYNQPGECTCEYLSDHHLEEANDTQVSQPVTRSGVLYNPRKCNLSNDSS